MKKLLPFLHPLLAAILHLAAPATSAQQPARIFCADATELESLRQRAMQGDAALAPALQKLVEDAETALTAGPFSVTFKTTVPPSGDKRDYMSQAPYWWPDPDKPDGLPYRQRDGQVNPDTTSNALDRTANDAMSETVATLALAYHYTADERYAQRTALLLRTWFLDDITGMHPNLRYGQAIPGITQGRSIGIIESKNWVYLLDASAMISTSPAWSVGDHQQLLSWFDEYLTWLVDGPLGPGESAAQNNHGTFYDVQVAAFALHVGRTELARTVLQAAINKRVLAQVEEDGRQPHELSRTRTFFYSTMNLRGLYLLAHLGGYTDADLWHSPDATSSRLRAAIDFLAPYADAAVHWPHPELGAPPRTALIPLLRTAAGIYGGETYGTALGLLPAGEVATDRARLGYPSPIARGEGHAVVEAQPYEAWAVANLPEGARLPNDRNGPLALQNLVSYAMGIDPATATAADLPITMRDPAQPEILRYSYTRAKSAVGLSHQIQVSEKLNQWLPASLLFHEKVSEDADRETWEGRIDTTGLNKLFLILRVTATSTTGYWRFENPADPWADSATAGTLTSNGANGVTVAASPFSNPVPLTNASNEGAASFDGGNQLSSAGDSAAYTGNAFSLEAFISGTFPAASAVIAGHFASGGSYGNQRGYYLGVNNGVLRLSLGQSNGTNTSNYDAFTLSSGTRYYVAATVDVTDGSATPGAITLYVKNLDSGLAEVRQFTRTGSGGVTITSIFDSSAPFTIGQTANATSGFNGLIDEVRLSNRKLLPSELLIQFP